MTVRFTPLFLLGALLAAWGCAHARPSGDPAKVALRTPPSSRPAVAPASRPAPASQPATAQRREQLRQLVQEVLAHPDLAKARVSILVAPATGGEPILAVEPDARRLPASNAKLLTTTAAALTLAGKYSFATEVSRGARGQLCLWGTGDPVLSRADLTRLARAVAAHGVGTARGIVVDDSRFDRERYAPGFEAFSAGSYYRPTSGAVPVASQMAKASCAAVPALE